MLSKDLEVTLNMAFKDASAKRHEFMTVEHLLLALLDNSTAVQVLKAVGCDLDKLRADLQEFVDTTTPLIPQDDPERETQPTLAFQRVLQRAVFHVQSSGRKEVTGANVLVAIFRSKELDPVVVMRVMTGGNHDPKIRPHRRGQLHRARHLQGLRFGGEWGAGTGTGRGGARWRAAQCLTAGELRDQSQ